MAEKPKDQEQERQLLPGQTKPDFMDHLADHMASNHADPGAKWGAGHVDGMLRAGLKELAQVLPAFPGQGVHPVEEPGIAGNPTNIEVVRDKEQQAENEIEAAKGHGVHGKGEDKQQESDQEPKQPGWMKRLAEVRERQKGASKEEEFQM